MPRLRVVLDQILAPVPGGVGRYTEELTRELLATAPAGWQVEAVIAQRPRAAVARVEELLPGLASVYRLPLSRRAMSVAWQRGLLAMPGRGVVHATSLFAPLYQHERSPIHQTVATIHDAVPWTHPETLTARGAAWHRAMAARAERFADAVVVPTEAVAAEIGEILRLGDRIRVVGSAVSPALTMPIDDVRRASHLGLPPQYLLAVGTLEPRKGLEALVRSLAEPGAPQLPLLVVGPAGWGGVDLSAVAASAGLPSERVRALGRLSDADLAVALSGATAFAMPSLAEGFGIPVLEAMHFGVPVVHSNAPALIEVAGGAGVIAEIGDIASFPARIAAALRTAVDDSARLRVAGIKRAAQYSWKNSAQKVWQLHADL